MFVIGDSVPRGPSFKEAYAYQFEKILKEKGIKAEVLNLAVPGYGVRRSQIVLKQVLKYQPDLIIKHVNWSNEYEDEREYRRAQEFKSWQPKHWLMKSLLLARLNEYQTENLFWKLLPKEIRLQKGVNDADAEIAASQNDEKRKQWRRLVDEKTLEDARILKDAGASGIFIIQVRARNISKGEPYLDDEGLSALQVLLADEGMQTLSMKELFFQYPDLKKFFSDESHLRSSGHQKIAEALAAKLNALILK
ncbi:MAG: SGNH/GDSL hydrolase family protein [Comamonadaceae bacterium]|nr:SGNH/GDSL hydrolase family protein [Comamonadaceae bacterium]